ncbi:MAG: ABC transporter permease subunit [Ornithinimicrobium sp.]
MIHLVRSEVLKYVSTRTAWGLTLGMFVTGLGFSALFGALFVYGNILDGVELSEVAPPLLFARIVYTSAIQFGYLLALVIGVLCIGQEYRHHTVTGTFLATPRRSRVIGAKVIALCLIAVVSGAVHVLGSLIGGGILMASAGLPVYPDAGELTKTLLLMLLVLALWTLIGLGVGVLIPNQVAALCLAIAVAWIVEPLAGFGLTFVSWGQDLSRFFPSQVTAATLDVFTGANDSLRTALGGPADPLGWGAGALVLLGYAAVMALIGLVLTRSRDIA